MRGHDDSGFAFYATRDTNIFGFGLCAPRVPDDSSCRLLGGARLASGHPTGASHVAGRCGPHLSHGSSAFDVFDNPSSMSLQLSPV
jgi:hypothetical protein